MSSTTKSILAIIIAIILIGALAYGLSKSRIRVNLGQLINPRVTTSPTPTPTNPLKLSVTPTPTRYGYLTPTPGIGNSGTKKEVNNLPKTGAELVFPLVGSASLGIFGWYLLSKKQ